MPATLLDERMTFEAFLRFYDTRPDDERWELFDGVPEMMPPPATRHQGIVTNFILIFGNRAIEANADWSVFPGFGIHVPVLGPSMTIPDVVVHPGGPPANGICEDPLILIEILSPGTRKRDLGWKKDFYRRVEPLRQFAIVYQDRPRVDLLTRNGDWSEAVLEGPDAVADFTAVGVPAPLTQIYRGTGLL